jgi:hypothetical protein
MSYQSLTIHQAINRLNKKFFLPSLQREFVWDDRQIIRLFDSIMRGYPISSFLFWQPASSTARRWTTYKFLEEISDGGSHSCVASLNGVSRPVFVLDGQQRLTALNIGLRGIYFAKEKYRWRNNPNAYKQTRLYIDLVRKNTGAGDDREDAETHFRFTFAESPAKSTKKSCWFEVGKILNCQSSAKLNHHIRVVLKTLPKSASHPARESVKETLRLLRRAIFETPTIFYHTETLPDYDRVLDIFVRANEAGTKLTKSDLLLSTLIANWEQEDARKEIHNFVDHLNRNLGSRNDLDKDFVIKACFVLCDLPVKYNISSFTRKNLKLVEKNWPAVKSALERCVNLSNQFGIDGENLSSANTLIPIAYYLYQNPAETLLGGSRWESRNADTIRRWLTMALLNGVFGGSSDTMLSSLRDVLRSFGKKGRDFPTDKLNKAISQRGRSANFDEKAVAKLLAFEYGDPHTFLALTLLYDEKAWGNIKHHQDHIFPKSAFSVAGLKRAGVPKADFEPIIKLRDHIGNLQLLTERENTQKRGQEFKVWIRTRKPMFRRIHLIPRSRRLYSLKQFENFLAQRERLIRSRLNRIFA